MGAGQVPAGEGEPLRGEGLHDRVRRASPLEGLEPPVRTEGRSRDGAAEGGHTWPAVPLTAPLPTCRRHHHGDASRHSRLADCSLHRHERAFMVSHPRIRQESQRTGARDRRATADHRRRSSWAQDNRLGDGLFGEHLEAFMLSRSGAQ